MDDGRFLSLRAKAMRMIEYFLQLSVEDQGEILATIAGPRSAEIIEKDIWVCWALEALFSMPNAKPMAFKGGTSLSKVYGVIHRFSEDVDVTIDYRSLDPSCDPLAPELSKTKRKKISEELKNKVNKYVVGEVVPHLKELMAATFRNRKVQVDHDDTGEKVFINYGSVASAGSGYLSDRVLLEFGGRNITEPNELKTITPYAAEFLDRISFPIAKVNVLSPRRTFWEKITLIHAECRRGTVRAGVDRLSRHWYDVAMLVDGEIGASALADRELLKSVVKHKSVFFSSRCANYEAVVSGAAVLIPSDEMMVELERDYKAMIRAGMFEREPPRFEEIMARLEELQIKLNSTTD
ncbi:MAG: nucleotidyl transferase AbiEii/AbiGii toxin family protein [Myxococcota bacterium]